MTRISTAALHVWHVVSLDRGVSVREAGVILRVLRGFNGQRRIGIHALAGFIHSGLDPWTLFPRRQGSHDFDGLMHGSLGRVGRDAWPISSNGRPCAMP